MSVDVLLINDLQKCIVSCVSLYVDFSQVSLSLKPYVRPSFSYIMSVHDVVMHATCLHRRHFLFEIDSWLNTMYCRNSKAGQSELGSCKLES
jgi:hypothetical protein